MSKNSNWAALLGEALQKSARAPSGPGWQNFADIQRGWGLGRVKAQRVLADLVSSGKVEMFRGSDVNAQGMLVRRIWYRICK